MAFLSTWFKVSKIFYILKVMCYESASPQCVFFTLRRFVSMATLLRQFLKCKGNSHSKEVDMTYTSFTLKTEFTKRVECFYSCTLWTVIFDG